MKMSTVSANEVREESRPPGDCKTADANTNNVVDVAEENVEGEQVEDTVIHGEEMYAGGGGKMKQEQEQEQEQEEKATEEEENFVQDFHEPISADDILQDHSAGELDNDDDLYTTVNEIQVMVPSCRS